MYIGQTSTSATLLNPVALKRLLVVGPYQDSMDGASATMKVFFDQLVNYDDIEATLVNSFALSTCQNQPTPSTLQSSQQFLLFLWHYLCRVARCDAVLLFANPPAIFSLAFMLLIVARLCGKRFLVKPIGGDLDLALAAQSPWRQRASIGLLNRMDGLLAQTVQLQTALTQMGIQKVYFVPGWRARPLTPPSAHQQKMETPLRLLYLSPIRCDKGPYVLLHALQQLAYLSQYPIICDFYGPISAEEQLTFMEELLQTPQARYVGLAEPGSAVSIMRHYDALVLPTYATGEGHPGVILEAMLAGLPVISTNHRAIPELVQQGVNGLLVPVLDSTALKTAIIQLAQNSSLRCRMGAAGYSKSQTYWADQIIPQVLQLIFPERAPYRVRR